MSHMRDPAAAERIARGNAQMAGWGPERDVKLAQLLRKAEAAKARKAASRKVRDEIRVAANQIDECAIVCALLESD